MFSRVFLLTRVWILEVWVEIWVLSTFASCIMEVKLFSTFKDSTSSLGTLLIEVEPQRVTYPKNWLGVNRVGEIKWIITGWFDILL